MIKWGSSSYRPSNGQGQGINPPKRQNILSPLEDRTPQGLVWGSQIVNVQKDGSTPEPSFDPMSIAGLQVWLDANDESTLNTYTSGSEVIVSGWTSKGNWTGTLSAETETRAPRFITNGGEGSSKAVYIYSGETSANNSGLIYRDPSNSFPVTSGITMFFFAKTNQDRTLEQGWGISSNLNLGQFTGSTNTTFGQSNIGISFSQNISISNQTGATTGYQQSLQNSFSNFRYRNITPYYLTAWGTDAPMSDPNGFGYNIIGQQYFTSFPQRIASPFTNILPRDINQVLINATWGSSPFYSNTFSSPQELYEILVYNRQLSESEYNQVRNYLLNKWDHTIDVPTGYTEVTITDYKADLTGNTPSSGNVWLLQENTPITTWSAFLGDLKNSKSYFVNENDTMRFNVAAGSTAGYFTNFDILGNGVSVSKLYNVQEFVESPFISTIPKPITISGVSQYERFDTTIYINYTGTSASSQFFVYDRYYGTGNIIALTGIQVLNTAFTWTYNYNWTPFDITYSDTANGASFNISYLNDCIQGDVRSGIDGGSGASFTLTPPLNPAYCVEVTVQSNP